MNSCELPERPVILTGFMGSGKSSVALALAEKTGWQLVDLDAEIVAAAGCSINEIFQKRGEAEFRRLESVQLERILARGGRMLIATGGGVVISTHNRSVMRAGGIVVNLEVSREQVLARLAGCTDRPLLAGDDVAGRICSLMQAREQFYADAHIRIDTNGKSVEDVSIEILSRLKGFCA